MLNIYTFLFQWFFGNYSYQEALSQTEVGIVNVLSSTSGLFTLILAALFPSSTADRFTLSKLVAVLFMVIGTVSDKLYIICKKNENNRKTILELIKIWNVVL